MTVYIDVVFLANLISSLLLLFSVRVIFNLRAKPYRIALSALVAGIYAVLEAVFLLPALLRTGVLYIMSVISFGKIGGLINTLRVLSISAAVVVLILIFCQITGDTAMVAEGGVTVISDNIIFSVILALSYPITVVILYGTKRYKRICRAEFKIQGNTVICSLLRDSGNLLRYKNIPVAVINKNSFQNITPTDYMIYNTVSSAGLMPLIKPESAVIGGTLCEVYIGLSEKNFSGYDGIIGNIN